MVIHLSLNLCFYLLLAKSVLALPAADTGLSSEPYGIPSHDLPARAVDTLENTLPDTFTDPSQRQDWGDLFENIDSQENTQESHSLAKRASFPITSRASGGDYFCSPHGPWVDVDWFFILKVREFCKGSPFTKNPRHNTFHDKEKKIVLSYFPSPGSCSATDCLNAFNNGWKKCINLNGQHARIGSTMTKKCGSFNWSITPMKGKKTWRRSNTISARANRASTLLSKRRYAKGRCSFHLTETYKCTNPAQLYASIKLFDSKKVVIGQTDNKLNKGLGPRINGKRPFEMTSKLPYVLLVKAKNENEVHFDYGASHWNSKVRSGSANCAQGGWDPRELSEMCLMGNHPNQGQRTRQMDCSFPC
ncbi:hypothetical protein PAAG_04834 [Paracoccidioides lutzii Pb01]|uniref:Secreted protein n=1 Tax=Paracoccidioides lutzii (strain ATCC MYA-826 / Pb01) TaxID=502779 RepID=C1H1P8_PARBA|nr:hypothetical protein PAAG_04834 [Paracoccidioides lutzii Pb01]EEH33785.2 hypothetical protein PAAG_04834 [Paracoccidioides lutzii Pb01]